MGNGAEVRVDFRSDLERLIAKYERNTMLGVSDITLAGYLIECLEAFGKYYNQEKYR